VNRSPAAAYVILRSQGWSPSAARGLILQRRPAATATYFQDAELSVGQLCPELSWTGTS
jgi:hypothetical protein